VISGFFDLYLILRRSWGLWQSLRPCRCGLPHTAISTKKIVHTQVKWLLIFFNHFFWIQFSH